MEIAETIRFADICAMLEKVKSAANIAVKEKYLRRYFESFKKHRVAFREETGVSLEEEETGKSSFYAVLRCLIPSADTVRSAYGLQITALGKVYVKVLQLPENSKDTQRLHARSYTGIHGDYADIVHSVLLPRCQQKDSDLTLKAVHDMLDTIAEDDRRNTEKVLTRLSEVASPREQMWFIRLLLKSMRLGIGEQRIFGVLHPQAKEVYQRCTNLPRICCLLADNKFSLLNNDPKAAGDQLNLNVVMEVFQHVRPMLCEIFPGNLEPIMAADVLYMETKMDGERFQLHYADGRFKYISRNGNDYTYSFGGSYNHGKLTPHLKNLLPIGMESIILDGEMMVWDDQRKKFRDKGENTDVKHLSENSSWHPCFVVYDMLYFNGRSLLDMPYVQRTYKLKEIIKEKPRVLQILKAAKVASMDEFRRMFQEALDANQEGVVLKKKNSIYRPGVRHGGGWYKIKADYIKGLTAEFDLLIIGGFYNRTRSYIDAYLVGVLKYKQPELFEVYSVGKVTNVIRQRAVLNETLKPHWHQLAQEPPPMWYHYKPDNVEGRPDVWIEPKNSTILQIKAADLAPSSAFTLAKALHFPRIQAWRNDKLWYECMTLQEFMQMCQSNTGIRKINKRALCLEDLTTDRKRYKVTAAEKRKIGLQAYEKKFNPTDIEQTSNIFEGFSFCILSACITEGHTTEQLKTLVVRNGGDIVENPVYHDPKCISIAGDITFRVQAMQKARRGNIISIEWLLRTCEIQEMQLKPKDMICMTKDLEEQFTDLFDKYDDSYVKPTTARELKATLKNIPNAEFAAGKLSPSQLQALEYELYKKKSPNFFRNTKAYFYDGMEQRTKFARMLYQLRRGISVDISHTKRIEYIFINLENFDKRVFTGWLEHNFKQNLNTLQVVNINWIIHSHGAKKKLDICEYSWHNF